MSKILERKLPESPPGIEEIQEMVKEFWDRKWLKKLPGGNELIRNLAYLNIESRGINVD